MNKIQEIEAQLAQAKKEELLKDRLKELEQIKKDYEGKCFGSHTFERNASAGYMGAVYYEKFFIQEDDIYVLEWNMSVSKYSSYHKKSKNDIQYHRNINQKKLTGSNNYNANYNLYSGYNFFRKEITLGKFMQLWEAGEQANIVIADAFKGKAPELKMELIRQGDSGNEANIAKCIADTGIDIIDFKKYPKVHDVLEYRSLPMFQERRWLPRIYAKPILLWHIDQLKKDMSSPFTTSRSREYTENQINIIQDFINKEL